MGGLYFVDEIGRKVMGLIEYTYRVLMMIYLSFRATLFHQTQGFRTIFGVVAMQVYFTGWQALPLISVLAVASGGVVVLQSTSQFNLLGGSNMLGQLLVGLVVREIAPLMTALIVTARSGTAVASELGTMRVNREIDALELMGINPLSFIVFPRLVGGIISVLCLSLYYTYISLAGAYIFARIFLKMPLSYFTEAVMQSFTYEDVYMLLVKNIFGGAIIFIICCYQGLSVSAGPHEVPQATTKAVVHSIIYVVGFNLIATTLFYLGQLIKMGIL